VVRTGETTTGRENGGTGSHRRVPITKYELPDGRKKKIEERSLKRRSLSREGAGTDGRRGQRGKCATRGKGNSGIGRKHFSGGKGKDKGREGRKGGGGGRGSTGHGIGLYTKD